MDNLSLKDTGLRGVYIASSKICDVKGKEGKLIYRGFLIEDLAKNTSFEEVCFLLLYERLPKKKELEDFTQSLKEKRKIPDNIFSFLKTIPPDLKPMDVLQAAIPMLSQNDEFISDEPNIEHSLFSAETIISGISVITAAWDRIRNNKEIIQPDPSLNHAQNFLYMLKGKKPDEKTARFFDISLVLHAEHSFNASTFTARQVASTKAHMYACISAAIGSLSGSLHGGANVRVMKMLKQIGSADKINDYVNQMLDSGKLIMGLGHAVYHTDDPRAKIIAPMSKEMGQIANEPLWYELSKQLEEKGKALFKEKKKRDIFCNVDFYSASLFYSMGIPIDLFTPIFAISRTSGWATHIIEERYAMAAPKPSLYRPAAEYVGDYCGPDECFFVDIDERE